jgi:cell division protein FtsW (lipid II flippase)
MNYFLLFSNLAMFICMAVSFTYGVVRFFKKGKALYLQMIVGGLGCMMLGRVFQFVTLLTRGMLPEGFHIGTLGIVGGFVFFLSANYGQMDKLLDDGAKENRKYRLLGLLAPLLMAGIYCLIFFFNPGLESMIVYGVMTVIIMFASYFNLKHFIFPDVEFGIIRSIRGYNLIALLLGVLSVGEITLLLWNKTVPLLILYIAICVVSIAVVPVLEKGVKKWTI